MKTLLRNTETLGPERALTIIHEIERMARESTEGQSLGLDWVHGSRCPVHVRDYFLMIYKKTCWYTCIAPMRVGAIIAGVPRRELGAFVPLGYRIGAAFQIQDDVLNLDAEESLYGKEICGDIAEGKRTLIAIGKVTVLRSIRLAPSWCLSTTRHGPTRTRTRSQQPCAE